ncbi:hypothetical protein [Haloprofundus marisrubri]|nr:hypothetical protein [Haloprofundus marisrubri]
MSYRTTIGWSIFSSGVFTLLMVLVLPGDSFYWGIGLTILGLLTLLIRR